MDTEQVQSLVFGDLSETEGGSFYCEWEGSRAEGPHYHRCHGSTFAIDKAKNRGYAVAEIRFPHKVLKWRRPNASWPTRHLHQNPVVSVPDNASHSVRPGSDQAHPVVPMNLVLPGSHYHRVRRAVPCLPGPFGVTQYPYRV